ncbi:c-type cytochrome [Silicimonas sp. MF1-12-2]|uniref:c-type cytochrome n=1 Tax=Silicimonas sp. MF1-12-2 TaxID=3384793 RepID=UPI0039B581BA
MKNIRVASASIAVGLALHTPVSAQDIDDRLEAASASSGESLFRQCKACHTIEKDGANRTGPNLYGVVGSKIGAVDGFRYSSALSEADGDWTPEQLDAFLADPRGTFRGTRMSYRGLSDPQQRADLILYLNGQSDNPLPISASASEATVEQVDEDFGLLVNAEGVDVTYYACTPCHSEMIVAQQGKTREGWDKLFDWMIEEQGMGELTSEDRNTILDYLAENYNTDRPNFPSR